MMKRILSLDPDTYRRHLIHGEGRIWAETNCYADLWIELLHALGHDPIAALPFTLAIDFEGDQWTFFKFPISDLYELYGLDVHELAVWRPLAVHIEEQLDRGRPVLVELDSYFLPDTAGTAYRIAHVKSTVAVVEIDLARAQMGYFHNQGYYRVGGEDFLNALRLAGEPDPALLPPYVEFVKSWPGAGSRGASLLEVSLRLLRRQLQIAPTLNPFRAFKVRFEKDLDWLREEGLEAFHLYSFATLRQFGACFELSQTYLEWLAAQGETGLEPAIRAFRHISEGAKAVQFQLARAISRRKPLDLAPIDAMAEHWESGISTLKSRYC
jgi:hypothetical protein